MAFYDEGSKGDSSTVACEDSGLEPIAVVGMGCRLPGDVSSPSDLWNLLVQGLSGHSEIPESRFHAAGFYNPDLNYPNSINARGGYFLNEDIRAFDNGFFGINNLEATYMDPQQRKLLEVVYECCENSGLTLEKLSGSNTGCYVANFTSDFQVLQAKDPETFHRYSATGMGLTILANRISHVFDLRGPSMVLDTACSSSLYSLHTACSALTSRECDGAFVAGANLIQSPEVHIATVKTGVLSGTSQCHTFDESADGYGRAEGVGAIFLKRLSDAIRDGDPIRSVIRATAVNSNGKTNGITLPSAYGQEAVIRKAYKRAGLGLDETDYVEVLGTKVLLRNKLSILEAHGTGTPVGDPIEVEALSRVFHDRRGRKTFIGSIKPSLGHSEAVSGISSVIKVTLALEQGLIPPTFGIQRINPDLRLDERNIKVATDMSTWPETGVRRASINSFGYGGANAHVILDAAKDHVPILPKELIPHRADPSKVLILPVSAHSQSSLVKFVEDLACSDIEHNRSEDLAYTLSVRRSHLTVRGFLLVKSSTISSDIHPSQLQVLKSLSEPSQLPLAFVFTGQGAQWTSMGSLLFERFPTFHRTIQELDNCLSGLPHPPSWTIRAIIQDSQDSSMINSAAYSQPVCTAIQIALIGLLQEWGIYPQRVLGHSSGEIAAAFAAGYITAAEAILIAYFRGQIMSKATSNDAMMSVGLECNSLTRMIRDIQLKDRLSIACINSPENVTVSGDKDAVEVLAAKLQKQNVFARKLETDGKAYHSRHMLTIGQEYEDLLSEMMSEATIRKVESTEVTMISSVTGETVEPGQTRTAAYWRKNLESPVLFCNAIHTLYFGKKYRVIEIGPHPALKLPIKQTLESIGIEKDCLYLSTLSRGSNSVTDLLKLAGCLFLYKYDVDIDKINCSQPAPSATLSTGARRQVLHSLPNLKWDYGPVLWHESRSSRDFRNREHPRHELLGTRVPGDNGKTRTWRNVLKVKDVPWLGDHKLGQTVVFPAAGYLAVAVEAFRQVVGSDSCSNRILAFRQVNFLKAMALLDENHGLEVLTELRPHQISSTTSSGVWWQYEISSHTGQTSTVHANGYIGLDPTSQAISTALSFSTASMEWQSMRNWYRKMPTCNINPGPSFHSLSEVMVDRMRKARQTMAKTMLRPDLASSGPQSRYVIHPTTIDAVLQTAWIASTAGSIEDLKGQIPVSIRSVKMAMSSYCQSPEPHIVRGISESVGFQSAKYSSELYGLEGTVQLQMQEMRASPYQEGAIRDKTSGDRYPMLRILWKPDISLLTSDKAQVLMESARRIPVPVQTRYSNSESRVMAGVLDLLAHKNPCLKILMLDDIDRGSASVFLDVLHANSSLRRFKSFIHASLATSGQLFGHAHADSHQTSADSAAIEPGTLFDIILMPSFSSAEAYLKHHSEKVFSHLANAGNLLFVNGPTDMTKAAPAASSTTVIPVQDSNENVIVLTQAQNSGVATQSSVNILLVSHTREDAFSDCLDTQISNTLGFSVTRLALSDISEANLPAKSIIVSTIELREPKIGAMTSADLESLKTLVERASIILWISGGNLYQAKRPDFAPVFGFARSVMLELPSVKFIVLDIDTAQEELEAAERNILTVLQRAIFDSEIDLEYLQHKGVLYISRFVPDQQMVRRFREKQDEAAIDVPLKDAGTCQLSIKQVGQMDTIHFVTSQIHDVPLDPDFVEVESKILGLNAKDVHVLSGRIDTKDGTCSAEIAGIVKRVGFAVTKFSPGDRVVVMAPGHFGTVERVPEWACCILREDEDLALMATIPGVSATVLYALEHRAKLEAGESILIHSAASGVGIAAIQIAKLRGAKIYATVSSMDKKSFLMKTFGLEESHIFSSRDSSFLPAVMQATSGRGVDVVLNFLTGDLLHDSWCCCAEFGRFVEIGKRDILDGGRLDMDIFNRGVTFTAFDLSSLYYSSSPKSRIIWQELLHTSIRLHREGKVQVVPPPKVYDISNVVQAFRAVSLSSRVGKVAVSLENPNSLISVVRPRYNTRLDPCKSYFLVGCLGGLGRSLSRWMFGQGARRLVFFGRSGTRKQEAQTLVEDLRNHGADVSVVYGDVTSFADVEQAIAQISGPIGGVIQAAMGLDEALFTAMTKEKWLKSIDPKIRGTWNIHNALKGKESNLDFFILTSSISGSVGTATECNYCSANAFLDAFARHRRSLGLRAISIGLGMISEVGYLHEHPEIEALLLRKGLHAITESEFLQMMDIALTEESPADEPYGSSHLMEGHVLTGLEAQGLQDIRNQGFEGGSHVLDDPRTSIMARVLSQDHNGNANNAVESNHGSHKLPKPVIDALAAKEIHMDTLTEALESFVAEKIRHLLLLPEDQLRPETPLSKFGLDSMLAAEFRQFIYRTFDIDVPFMMLLAKTTSVASLAKDVAEGLLGGKTVENKRS